jgi:hypothetical protein
MVSDNEPKFEKIAENLERFKDFVKSIAKEPIYGLLDTLREGELASDHSVFTYVEALEYAIDIKLKYPTVKSTLLKLDRSSKGLVITQFFIDNKEEIIPKKRGYLGRKVSAKKLDEELDDIFGNDDSVVIDLAQR